MTAYVIGTEGCDDSTYALVEMTEEQAAWLRLVRDAINARSDYGCKPVIYLEPEETAGRYERERATETIEETA